MIALGKKEINLTFIRTSGYSTTPSLGLCRPKCRSCTSANAEIDNVMFCI